jgi:hypothetical protein
LLVQAFPERNYQFEIASLGDIEISSGDVEFPAAVATAQLYRSP